MFVHDLIKPSIQLDEDDPTPALGTPSEGDGPAPTPDTNLGTLPGLASQA
jgi:hypothetical protein